MKYELKEAPTARLARLLELMREIQTNPHQMPEQLAQALHIKRSQYFDDKKLLAQIGFEFDYDRSQKRYVIRHDVTLAVADLSGMEALALVMAVRQISAAGDHTLAVDAIRALKKIIASSNPQVRNLLQYALDDDVLKQRFKVDARLVETLWQARDSGWRLEIEYDDFSQQRLRKLEVDPYALYFKGRALYLDAYVAAEQKVLMLRVSRVKAIVRRSGVFQQRADYNFGARHRHSYRVITGNQPPQLVRIKFAPHAARYVDEAYHHHSEKKIHFTDGSLELRLTVSEPREVLWYLVFPWGAAAEVLEPAWLREEAVRTAQQIAAQYQPTQEDKR